MEKIDIVEVGPRDGFQNVREFIPTAIKIEIINRLIDCGISKVQVCSFTSPKAMPQMKDAKEVVEAVMRKNPQAGIFALVPNLFGAMAAAESGLREISTVLSLSESHNRANVKLTVAQSVEEVSRIREALPEMEMTQDIATVFACPFEGIMEISPLIDLIGRIQELGVHSFTLCDTIGMAHPKQVEAVLDEVTKHFPDERFGLHFHDTRNTGILNSYCGIQNGVKNIQASLGGLGGCPFAPGASGNIATEDLVYLLQQEGYETGINIEKLLQTAKYLKANVQGSYSGHHVDITNECRQQ